ncbi:uncharacterized protein LOC124379974 [Silurus meridionalis]|uniref:uncharacterized protein LOC124379974 n=1 Tax=Silurus meridionalis TaxID=175797 RepID=UPI001EEA2A06|nr:uncharacterized protein LOC124379974 [Silurus meridionalis]
MLQGSKNLVFLMNKSGKSLDAQHEFIELLKKHIRFQQVNSANECDAIIAFVPVMSRAGTDIEAALKNIPTTHPVVLVALHHTFDENYVAPESKMCVNRNGVFAGDLLWYEDFGLLRCLANNKALESIAKHLSPNISEGLGNILIPVNPRPQRRIRICVAVFVLAVLLTVCIYFLVISREGQNGTPTTSTIPLSTQQTNTTATTQQPNITAATQG